MEEHQDDSSERIMGDELVVNENSDAENSQEAFDSVEENENSMSTNGDNLRDDIAAPTVDEESSGDSSDSEKVPVNESGIADASVPSDTQDTIEEDPDEVDASHSQGVMDDEYDLSDQKRTIETTASDNLSHDVDSRSTTDESANESEGKNLDLEVDEDSTPCEANECEPEVSNLDNTEEAEPQADKMDDVSDKEQDTVETNLEVEQTDDVLDKDHDVSENNSDQSDFLGFDSTTIKTSLEKTTELLQTLNDKEVNLSRSNIPSDTGIAAVQGETSSAEETKPEVTASNAIRVAGGNDLNLIDEQSNADALAAETLMKNSRKSNPVHPVLGVPVNIFDETLPSGSKRVKKKRKFFGDFEESDAERVSRTSGSSRPSEDSVRKQNNTSGENKENFITEEKLKVDSVAESDATSQNKKRSFDISNPLFREPFKHGWKREVCYRNLPEGSKSKPAYVSYYSPQGKKFKTIRQIVEILPSGGELNMQHFTFSVHRIFNEPSEFEILRDAKSRTDLNDLEVTNNDSFDMTSSSQSTAQITHSEPVKSVSKKKQPYPANRLVIKKPKYLKQTDSEDDGAESLLLLSSTPPSTTPKIVIKGASLNSAKANSLKAKSSSAKKDKKSNNKKQEKNSKRSLMSAEHAVHPMNSFHTSTPVVSKIIDNRSTCSINCPLALGSIPTLQCTVCHNLYHFECCGFDASLPVPGYVCKSCRGRAEIQSKLLLAVSQSSASSNTLGYGGSDAVMSDLRAITKNTKIVDGVTTWLPPSSNVQLSSRHSTMSPALSNATEGTQTTLLQSVLELDGKRYIIVPKESIVSISPNTNSIVNTFAGSYEQRQNDSTEQLQSDLTASKETAPCMRAETSRNYVVNSSEVNSAGVLLVPVMPSGNEPYCNQIERGSSKRKLSEDSNTSTAKMSRLDGEWNTCRYSSPLTLSNVASLYNPLTICFKYLTVRDLLRVSMSCKYLNRIASETSLWTTVRLKNSKVRDWEGFARTLRKYGTKKLDLRKMLCPSAPNDVSAMWNNFLEKITSVTSLEHIEFSRCNAHVVETVARTCPNLVVINAVQLRNGDSLSLESFTKLKYLRELRLKGGLQIESCNDRLDFQSSETMRLLSLTSIKNLDSSVVKAVGDLGNLNILELGECNGELADELAISVGKLNNLRKLRLEQVTNLDPHFKLFESLRGLPQLRSLELVNIEIRMGFCEAIAACTNIEHLLIIPLYKTESATSNRLVLDSLPPLSNSLKSFVWGLTHELIRATGLYATQYLDKQNGDTDEVKTSPVKGPDSIPIVKRISKHPEVDILSVRNLEKMVAATLPQTRVKVITIQSSSTWRQSLSDLLK